ncbi:MAG: hypothetical protein VXY34_09870 [Bdellovibrionota bacterium]|nr:hypothetical protein [Bdellovibrionota bacterium]
MVRLINKICVMAKVGSLWLDALMKDQKLNENNWREFLFNTKKLFTFISEGVEVSDFENLDDESINFVYNVVTTNHDFQEKHLKTFSDLQDALQYVNLKCSEWDFSPKNGLNKDGCGTCSAH